MVFILIKSIEVMPKKPKHFWLVAQNCRRFFDAFAREAGFDPLDPQNWYGIDYHRLLTNKVGYNRCSSSSKCGTYLFSYFTKKKREHGH